MARTVASRPGDDTPALASANTMSADDAAPAAAPPPIEVGQMLGGRYEVLGELGRGGEGVVLRARDHRADVVVALKLLVDEGGGARLRKFRRELQAARRVTHPGVVRIYDLVELPGRFGLSMEYVEGETLARGLERGGPLAADEVMRLASDLAEALAAAHASGVTHRDLKPANIIVRARDGRAVITDFGVSRMHGAIDAAKVELGPRGASQGRLTVEGALVGTPHYMAPEQLEGSADIGPTADVYAFGLVVREAATGKLLHDAPTFFALQEARLKASSAPLAEERADLPAAFTAIVDRCVERDRGARFPDGRALAAALGRLRKTSAAPPPAVAAERPRAKWPLAVGVTALVALTGALGFGALRARPVPPVHPPPPSPTAAGEPSPRTPPIVFQPTHVRRMTFDPGCEENPSFFPDGKTIVYDSPRGDEGAVYALSIADGATRRLTAGPGMAFGASVSPDGRRLTFARFGSKDESGTYVMDLDGHAPARRIAKGNVPPSWAVDGRAVWTGTETRAELVDADTGAVVRGVDVPTGYNLSATSALAGGAVVLEFAHYTDTSGGGVGVASTDGAFHWVYQGDLLEALAVTADGKHALVTARRAGMAPDLLDVPLDGSPFTSHAASGIAAWAGVRLAPDGKSVAWSTCRSRYQLVRFDGYGGDDAKRGATVLEPDADWDDLRLAPVPGTGDLVTTSRRGGAVAAWVLDPSGHETPRAIGLEAAEVGNLDVSLDRRFIALHGTGKGIWISPFDGSAPPRQLTSDKTDARPRFTRDGLSIVFDREGEGHVHGSMRVAVDGGEPEAILDSGASQPTPSPAGDLIAYLAEESDGARLPMVFDGRRKEKRALSPRVGRGEYDLDRFSADGKRLTLTRGYHDIVEVDVETGRVVWTVHSDDQISDVAYAAGALFATRGRMVGDVWSGELGN
jgi:Tol biopolymer transport system component